VLKVARLEIEALNPTRIGATNQTVSFTTKRDFSWSFTTMIRIENGAII